MNKDDLIRRSDVLEELKRWKWGLPEHEVELAVAAVPAVDAEPVVHAHWIEHDDDLGLSVECSACHAETCGKSPRCMNCGAHMDEGVSE